MSDAPDEAADVNTQVEQEWVAETTPFERVRTVTKRTYDGQSAAEIADRARTSPTTARKHLAQLVEAGFLETVGSPDSGATLYRRSASSLVLEEASSISDRFDTDTLVDRINEMKADIGSLEAALGIDSPEEAALTDEAHDAEMVQELRTSRRNLKLVQAALALERAEDVVEPA